MRLMRLQIIIVGSVLNVIQRMAGEAVDLTTMVKRIASHVIPMTLRLGIILVSARTVIILHWDG